MQKWMLFALLGVGDLIVAVAVYLYSGRVVIPAVLALAAVFFIVAAVQAKGKGS